MFAEAAWMYHMGADHIVAMRLARVSVEPVTAPADPEYIRGLSLQLLARLRPDYLLH